MHQSCCNERKSGKRRAFVFCMRNVELLQREKVEAERFSSNVEGLKHGIRAEIWEQENIVSRNESRPIVE